MRLPLLGPGAVLVVNGDIWTDIDFGALRFESDAAARGGLTCSCPILRTTSARGFRPRGDRVVERETADASHILVSGVYRPELFAGCSPGKFPLLPLLKRAIAAGRLRGELCTVANGATSGPRSVSRS